MSTPIVRDATVADAPAITAIYNAGIAGRAATFETEPRSIATLERRLAQGSRYPHVVVDVGAEGVVGWAGLSEYRPRACYSGIAELSVYVGPKWQQRGIGRLLMQALIDRAERAGFWKLVARVFTFNGGSRALCRSTGFREVGTYERHGYLEGEWRDVVIVERLLEANLTPSGVRVRQARNEDWAAVAGLLEAASLPQAGALEAFTRFVVALAQDRVVGAAGLEGPDGPAALLRSVVVSEEWRGKLIGRQLVDRALSQAGEAGVREVVLLTTTAEKFFAGLGFARIRREEVPTALTALAEFTSACPDSAAVMRRRLTLAGDVK